MREMSEGERLYWQGEKEAKNRIRQEYGIFGLLKARFLWGNDFSWEYAEEEMRLEKIKSIYKV